MRREKKRGEGIKKLIRTAYIVAKDNLLFTLKNFAPYNN